MSYEELLLYRAIDRNDIHSVTNALSGNVDVNTKGSDGLTFIMRAILEGADKVIIEKLIEANADINVMYRRINIAFLKASRMVMSHERESLDIVELLWDHGAVNANTINMILREAVIECAFQEHPGKCNRVEIMKFFIDKGVAFKGMLKRAVKKVLEIPSEAALHKALCEQYIRLLLKLSWPLEKVVNGFTPLMLAVEMGEMKKTRLLLSLGANPNCEHEELKNPLYDVAPTSILYDLIFFGAEYNGIDKNGNGPLMKHLQRYTIPIEHGLLVFTFLIDDCFFNDGKVEVELLKNWFGDIHVYDGFVNTLREEKLKLKMTNITDCCSVYDLCLLKRYSYKKKFIGICKSEFYEKYFNCIDKLAIDFPRYHKLIQNRLELCELFENEFRNYFGLLDCLDRLKICPYSSGIEDGHMEAKIKLDFYSLLCIVKYLNYKDLYSLYCASFAESVSV